jgi:hypothetical protein
MNSIPEVLEESNINWMIIRYGNYAGTKPGYQRIICTNGFKAANRAISTNPETPEHVKALLS